MDDTLQTETMDRKSLYLPRRYWEALKTLQDEGGPTPSAQVRKAILGYLAGNHALLDRYGFDDLFNK